MLVAEMRLATFMEARRLSDEEMARRVGCSAGAIYRLKMQYFRPSLERAYRIEQVTKGHVGLADWQYPVRYQRSKASA